MLAAFTVLLVAMAEPPRPAPTPPPPLRLFGQVKDGAGKPVAKALVIAHRLDRGAIRGSLTTRSDAAGAFTLLLDPPGDYALRVEAGGLAPYTSDHLAVPKGVLAVTLGRGGAIEGVVKDGRGRPVAGARVESREYGGTWAPAAIDTSAGRVRTVTDGRGLFRLEGLAPARHAVTASARGIGSARRMDVTAGKRLELFLTPGADVVGTVRGPDGRPVPEATVALQPDMPFSAMTLTERTDERGAFQFQGITPGPWRAVAWRAQMAPALADVRVEKNGERPLALRLGAPARLRGRLVDAEGRPQRGTLALQEVEGQAVRATLGELLRTEADEEGRFTLDGMPRAAVALAVSARGFVARRVEAVLSGPQADVGDVTLDRGLAISGRVVDAAGRGVAGASVLARLAGPMGRNSIIETTTETAGRFSLGGAEQGLYEVTAEASGFARASLRVAAGGDAVDIVLQGAGSIVGTVVDETGAAVAAFDAMASPADAAHHALPHSQGAGGRLALEDVPAGGWTVDRSTRDGAAAHIANVVVRTGAATDLGRVRLLPGATVRGRVTDADGSPIPGATVRAAADRSGFALRQGVDTDATGAFELRGLDPGPVDLVASHPEFASARLRGFEVSGGRGNPEARIVLSRGGRIEGLVRRRDGRALERMHVMANPLAGGHGGGVTSVASDGTFALDHVSAGRQQVTLVADNGGHGVNLAVKERVLEVVEGEAVGAEFLLRDITVSGTVTRGGEPAQGVRLSFHGQPSAMIYHGAPDNVGAGAGPQRGWAVVRPDGTYELLVSDPGTYGVEITSADGHITYPSRRVDVPDADAAAFDFRVGGTSVSGTAVAADTGRPLQVDVLAVPVDGGAPGQWTRDDGGADGRFELELEPGAYKLQASAVGYGPETVPLTVGDSPVRDLRFALALGGRIAGRVVDAAGRAVGNVPVVAYAEADDPGRRWSRTVFAIAAPDGAFVLNGLGSGTHTLTGGGEGSGFAIATGAAVGSTDALLRLAPGGRLRATVRQADGAPAVKCGVHVRTWDDHPFGDFRGPVTDADGVAELAVPAGRLEVVAVGAPGNGRAAVTVAPGETGTVEIRLDPR